MFTAYKAVIDKCSQAEPNFVELSALAAMLHSFYTGVENLLKRITLGIDGHVPVGVSSHSELLAVMAQPTTKRPPVISDALRERLSAYLSFRHVFRHAYSYHLEWPKMQDLVWQSEETWRELKAELERFFA